VRQIAHRAREHVHARRRRYEPADSAMTCRVIDQFVTAATTGDMTGLLATLSPSVTWTADGGGKASAARRPVVGPQKTAALVLGLFRQMRQIPDARVDRGVCNGAPALIAHRGEQLEAVFLIEVIDGAITHFYAVRNPDKLAAIAAPRTITR
jgi:RNA polymerase sigma-70 factor (ECF subfamily)